MGATVGGGTYRTGSEFAGLSDTVCLSVVEAEQTRVTIAFVRRTCLVIERRVTSNSTPLHML